MLVLILLTSKGWKAERERRSHRRSNLDEAGDWTWDLRVGRQTWVLPLRQHPPLISSVSEPNMGKQRAKQRVQIQSGILGLPLDNGVDSFSSLPPSLPSPPPYDALSVCSSLGNSLGGGEVGWLFLVWGIRAPPPSGRDPGPISRIVQASIMWPTLFSSCRFATTA